jgi:malyl-CoA/(S)-citramalyl-CoA lyase
VRAKVPETAREVDVILANLEDAIPADAKQAARAGAIEMAGMDLKGASFWARINALNSPWHLDDVTGLVAGAGERLDVIMVPKVEGPWDIHYMDQLLALLEAKHRLGKPILLHAILETAQGVANVEAISGASPRMQGVSLGPADLAASRKMKTTRVGGGHPGYRVIADPDAGERQSVQQDLWHYTFAKMVDACAMHGIKPFYGPFGDIADAEGCEQQFRNAYLMGCVGAWSLHPNQIAIAKRVFTPDVEEVKFALRILEAMPEGSGVAMLDGRMQDDATWKQAKVMVDLARLAAAKEPLLAEVYGI